MQTAGSELSKLTAPRYTDRAEVALEVNLTTKVLYRRFGCQLARGYYLIFDDMSYAVD